MSASVQGYVANELARGGYQNVHDLLAQACAKHPQRAAFSCGDDQLTYAELGTEPLATLVPALAIGGGLAALLLLVLFGWHGHV